MIPTGTGLNHSCGPASCHILPEIFQPVSHLVSPMVLIAAVKVNPQSLVHDSCLDGDTTAQPNHKDCIVPLASGAIGALQVRCLGCLIAIQVQPASGKGGCPAACCGSSHHRCLAGFVPDAKLT